MSISPKRLTTFLSMYIDNELSMAERIDAEKLIDLSPEARKILEDLRKIKYAMGETEPLPPNPDFYEELYRRLPRPVFTESRPALFPRKFVPAFAGIGALAVVVLVSLAVIKSDFILDFFSKTTQDVQQAYEDNVVKGWIMPLFEKTDRDEALQYAMFGVLPLDDSSNTILKVDNSVDKGYTFELGQANQPHFERVTVEDLYREVEPTETQRQILDTIFFLASKQIEEGVLVDENEQLAIAPSVIDLQRSLMAKVAASLNSSQRVKMDRFLEAKNAFFAVRASDAPPVPKTTLVKQIERNAENNTYVMISRDTILLSEINLDRKRLRENMLRAAESRRLVEIKMNKLAQQLAKRWRNAPEMEPRAQEQLTTVSTPVRVGGGSVGMRVHITIDRGQSQSFVATYVEPRSASNARVQWSSRNNVLTPSRTGAVSEGATIELQIEMDSMLSIQEEALQRMEQQLRRMDSRQWQVETEDANIFLNLDSLEKIIRITTDSMHIELRKLPGNLRTPDRDSSLPPGIEIRPDYYEEQQRQNGGRPQYMLDSYKQKFRQYKSQHEQLRKVTSSTGRTTTGSAPVKESQPKK